MPAQAQRKRQRQEQERQQLRKLREPVIRVLPAIGAHEAMQALPKWCREKMYEVARPRLIPTIDAQARRFEGARLLLKFLTRQMDYPYFAVPGFNRKLTPNEIWSVLPILHGWLNGLIGNGKIPAEIGRGFLDANIGEVLSPHYEQLGRHVTHCVHLHSRIDKGICYLQHRPLGQTAGSKEMVIHVAPAQERRFVVDGHARPAYRCGGYFDPERVTWTAWQPELVGLPASHPPLDVYLQSHALHRLFERLDMQYKCFAHSFMAAALHLPRVTVKPDGSIWAQCHAQRGALGYFVGNIVDGCVLLRSFLFVTMEGTAEHATLKKRLRVSRRDIAYLKLDDIKTFMKSDLADDAELVEILRECNLGHLLELRQMFSGEVETGQASFMRTYLGLPQAAGMAMTAAAEAGTAAQTRNLTPQAA